jgi:SAM-dependent methyltransferase
MDPVNINSEDIGTTTISEEKPEEKTNPLFTKIPPEEDDFLTNNKFRNFTYSKISHFDLFHKYNYDLLLNGKRISAEDSGIKKYQNLLIYTFIEQNIKEGSRILEINPNDQYIFNHFKYRYDFWTVNDVTNLTKNLEEQELNNIPVYKDSDDTYHTKVPFEYFDFIFSTSPLDTLPDSKYLFEKLADNLYRLLKPSGYVLNSFPSKINDDKSISPHIFIYYLMNNITKISHNVLQYNNFIGKEDILNDEDLHFSDVRIKSFKDNKKTETKIKNFSFNFLWRKRSNQIPASLITKSKDYLSKRPAYVYHHLMKCGGSSLEIALKTWFCLEIDKLENSPDDINQFIKYKLDLNNFYSDQCLIGHFQYNGIYLKDRYPEIFEKENEFKLFTFVRDPMKMRISLYYYVRNRGGFQKFKLKQVLLNTPNFLSRLFPCDESNYKEVLDRYFFIGIVEKMQESIDILAKKLNKKSIIVPRVNVSDKDSQLEEITPEITEEFKRLNKLDYLIYEYCLEKFYSLEKL